jgi:hypothetical protein
MSLSASQSRTDQQSTESRIAAAEHAVAGRADNGATLIQVGAGSDLVSLKALDTVAGVVSDQLSNRKIDANILETAFAQQTALTSAVNDRFATLAQTAATGGASDSNKLILYLGGGAIALVALSILRKK